MHDSVPTVVTQDGISARGSAALQAEAARVRKDHERQADLETAIMLGGSDEDLHEPTRNEDVGADAIGAAGTVLGNIFDRGDKLEAPTIEEGSGSSDRKNREATSGSLNRPHGSRMDGDAGEQRFAEQTIQFLGLRQHRRRR